MLPLRARAARRAARLLSTVPGAPPKPPGLFDRLLPADPPELAAYKAREARLIREQVGRSKFMDAHRAMGADKVGAGGARGAGGRAGRRAASGARARAARAPRPHAPAFPALRRDGRPLAPL